MDSIKNSIKAKCNYDNILKRTFFKNLDKHSTKMFLKQLHLEGTRLEKVQIDSNLWGL